MNDPGPWTPPERRSDNSGSDDAQRIFDTVTGPNLRVSDNLIQLAAICGGTVVCAIIGAVWAWMTNNHPMVGVLVGGFAGVLISLFLSGAVLGLVRFMSAVEAAADPLVLRGPLAEVQSFHADLDDVARLDLMGVGFAPAAADRQQVLGDLRAELFQGQIVESRGRMGSRSRRRSPRSRKRYRPPPAWPPPSPSQTDRPGQRAA